MNPLHITASLKVVGKHLHHPHISVYDARDIIRDLAVSKTLSRDDKRLIEDLERVTQMSIYDLAERTREWVPGDDPAKPPGAPRRRGGTKPDM